jgi:hypothetical protein
LGDSPGGSVARKRREMDSSYRQKELLKSNSASTLARECTFLRPSVYTVQASDYILQDSNHILFCQIVHVAQLNHPVDRLR